MAAALNVQPWVPPVAVLASLLLAVTFAAVVTGKINLPQPPAPAPATGAPTTEAPGTEAPDQEETPTYGPKLMSAGYDTARSKAFMSEETEDFRMRWIQATSLAQRQENTLAALQKTSRDQSAELVRLRGELEAAYADATCDNTTPELTMPPTLVPRAPPAMSRDRRLPFVEPCGRPLRLSQF